MKKRDRALKQAGYRQVEKNDSRDGVIKTNTMLKNGNVITRAWKRFFKWNHDSGKFE